MMSQRLLMHQFNLTTDVIWESESGPCGRQVYNSSDNGEYKYAVLMSTLEIKNLAAAKLNNTEDSFTAKVSKRLSYLDNWNKAVERLKYHKNDILQ